MINLRNFFVAKVIKSLGVDFSIEDFVRFVLFIRLELPRSNHSFVVHLLREPMIFFGILFLSNYCSILANL